MPNYENRISDLIIKELNGELNDAEESELETWKNLSEKNRAIVEEFLNEEKLQAGIRDMYMIEERIWGRLEKAIMLKEEPVITPVRRMRWTRVAAAAVIFLLVSAGTYFYFNKGTLQHTQDNNPMAKTDVAAPASNRAMITLANGKQILLDSAGNGTLLKEGNVNVVKLADGQIVYTGSNGVLQYNTMTNPRGSQAINLTLSDGSKVWLNAESSLKFPVAFVGNERTVEITGEAYFEVAKNASKKFLVIANGVTTEVLGTHFNVNAYADEEALRVTLLEGSVKVSKNTASKIIKPGQQTIVQQTQNDIVVVTVNIDEVMAWKNGLFSFNKANIQTVMRQISRWYDVEVSYEGVIRNRQFNGEMERNLNLSQVLKALEKSKVHFRIEGKKLIVMP